MIPVWINMSIWILWSIWTYVEVAGYLAYRQHNSSSIMVRLHGRASYTRLSFMISVIYIVLSVFWITYNLMGD